MNSLQGHLLVATRGLRDPNFAKTVVLIIQHDEEGAMGLILNRPMEMTVRELWHQVGAEPCHLEDPLHQGGPVNGPLMVLHDRAELSQVAVADGLHFTADAQSIQAIVEQGEGPTRFFAGYSGWTPGQLESEIAQGAWLTAPAAGQAVFNTTADLWTTLMGALAPGLMLRDTPIRHIPEDPSHN